MNMFAAGTAKTPEEYLKQVPEEKNADVQAIHDLIRKTVPNMKPYMIGQIIGYGTYHYKGKSGREGDWCIIGLSARKNYISVYVCAIKDGKYMADYYKDQLPKADIGKSCIRFKKNVDIDLKILARIFKDAEKQMKQDNYSVAA